MSWNAIPKRCGRVKRRRAPRLKDRFDGPTDSIAQEVRHAPGCGSV